METSYVRDFEGSKTPPSPPTHESFEAEPQPRTLLIRVLFSVVAGRKAKIWFGVLMPTSMPLVTARPLLETVVLLQAS